MSLPVIICDDSSFARKQAERTLPEGWRGDVTFCENGREAIRAVLEGKGDFMLLDLTMPVMNGFEVLEYIRTHDLPTVVVVVSGDIQEDSYKRVMALGALAFIKKPIDQNVIRGLLTDFGLYSEPQETLPEFIDFSAPSPTENAGSIGLNERLGEISNVAMGRAADLLSSVIDSRVEISIPKVNVIESTELEMMLHSTTHESVVVVNQGFIGRRIAGETLVVVEQHDIPEMAALMGYTGELDRSLTCELVIEVANILVGAFLKGFSGQLDINLSQGQPEIIIHNNNDENAITLRGNTNSILAIELSYTLGIDNVRFDQLVLFTESSQPELTSLIEYSMW